MGSGFLIQDKKPQHTEIEEQRLFKKYARTATRVALPLATTVRMNVSFASINEGLGHPRFTQCAGHNSVIFII